MAELKCPHCGQAFTVDDTELSSIVQQIRDKEFEKDVKSRVDEMTRHMQREHELELNAKENDITLKLKEENDRLRKEIDELKKTVQV